MKTTKDNYYSKEHTKQRLFDRYNIIATDDDYDDLCELISNRTYASLIDIEIQSGGAQEIYSLIFKGCTVIAVWNPALQIVKTVLPEV